MSMSTLVQFVRICAFAALLGGAPALHAACPKGCLSVSSVVHAAGVPPELSQAARQVQFEGDQLSAGSKAAVARLAKQLQLLPGNAAAELKLSADAGIAGAAAKAQVLARRQVLSAALAQAGVAPARYRFNAD